MTLLAVRLREARKLVYKGKSLGGMEGDVEMVVVGT